MIDVEQLNASDRNDFKDFTESLEISMRAITKSISAEGVVNN